MSGLLALLDDVAAIARLAASSVDDVAGMAAKAGSKAAGVVIDDAAVTPKYVHGLDPKRELPIIWKIARASFFNKLVILLPVALALNAFAPWLITPLLMLGGFYLCFEGAEKVHHWLFPHADAQVETDLDVGDPVHLEEKRVKGAIKTDFILSAEIMTISLAAIPEGTFLLEAATLAIVAVGITALVYGTVGLIVKMDDIGLALAAEGRSGLGRGLGRGLVKGMPHVMKLLSIVGTVAMLWVGGSILVHGTHDLGWHLVYDGIHGAAAAVGEGGVASWAVTAGLDGLIGLAAGLLLIPVVGRVMARLTGGSAAH
jgi:predicted DNA repair protein MutK